MYGVVIISRFIQNLIFDICILITSGILCGIVVNEIEGMMAENISESDIENILKKGIET